MSILRESAKFLAGVAACETLVHLWLGIWGTDLLPMQFRWFAFTAELNTYLMMFWPLMLFVFAYLGWGPQYVAPGRGVAGKAGVKSS